MSDAISLDDVLRVNTLPKMEQPNGTELAEKYFGRQNGDFMATMEFRVAVPEGTHTPDQEVLQQLWIAPAVGGGRIEQWRDIPRVLV